MKRQVMPIQGEDIDLPEIKSFVGSMPDWSKLTPEQLDHMPFKVGHYAGHSPSKVAEWNPAYIVALYEGTKRCSEALYRDCKADMLSLKSTQEVSHDLDFDHDDWGDFF